MKMFCQWILTAFVALCLTSCSHSPAPTARTTQQPPGQVSLSKGPPALEVPETVFDFGEVSEEDECVHDFKVLNKGTGDLEIKKVLAA